MAYTSYQIIILFNASLSLSRKKEVTNEIRDYTQEFARKVDVKYEGTKDLAYKIDKYDKAWFVGIKLKIREAGANKRIKELKEKLNTYEEIINFKIIQKRISEETKENQSQIFIVYEFDYGDIGEGIEPNVTIFQGYEIREEAEEKANELLVEGLENYFIENRLRDNKNPFKDNDEVHLYEKESADEQENSVYYIKIEKIKVKRKKENKKYE